MSNRPACALNAASVAPAPSSRTTDAGGSLDPLSVQIRAIVRTSLCACGSGSKWREPGEHSLPRERYSGVAALDCAYCEREVVLRFVGDSEAGTYAPFDEAAMAAVPDSRRVLLESEAQAQSLGMTPA